MIHSPAHTSRATRIGRARPLTARTRSMH
jgi:hypothetical protein